MKKKIAIGLLAVVAVYVAWEQVKGNVFTWYAINMMERETDYPSSEAPDQVCLTWSGDPATTQAVNWRTSTTTEDGWVEYRAKGTEETSEVSAERLLTEDKMLKNDPRIHRYTAYLKELSPGTEYEYRAGSKDKGIWTDWYSFKTAPAAVEPYQFLYLGDAQVGIEYYGELLHRAHGAYPNAAFHIVAGDLVNSGACRNEWDEFFHASTGVFNHKTLLPCLGNHDYQKQDVPSIYLDSFALPLNGPAGFPPERAFSFTYSNTFFVVLDSNRPAEEQSEWLDQELAASQATWKIALYHHPAYSSAPHRDNDGVLEHWCPLFDKHGVDIALQGHDHAYLRTYPMRGGKRAADGEKGTYYTVTVSGTKYYEQEQHDYAEVAFPEVSTYQVIDVSTNPDRLTYKAYDFDHVLRDEFVIEK